MIKTSLSIDRSHTHGKTLRPTPSIVNIYSIDMTKYQEGFSAESNVMSDPETHPSIVLQLPQTKSVLGDLRQCHLRCSDVAVMIVVFVLIGVAVALVLFPNRDTQPATMFTLEHVQLLGIVDNRVQRMAYRAGLVLLAIFFLAALYFTPRCFFFNDTAPTEIYTLSLHDALPI